MPSILNTPANKIPLHLFHLPIAQREVLLVNVLTNPILYKWVIRQLFSHLTVPHLLVQITEAFDPILSAAHTAVLVLLVDRGLNRLLGMLPRDHLASILRTVILSLLEEQWRVYYGTDGPVEGTVQTEQENGGPPIHSRINPCSPCPA